MFSFIDEKDCGEVTCSLKDDTCKGDFKPSNDVLIKDKSVVLTTNNKDGYGPLSTCLSCESKS